MKKQLSILAVALLSASAVALAQAPAFPGAEGFGRYTTGGRGGVVKHVTNLNDSGAGSFREAVKGSSKKVVVFDVSGVIELNSDLTIGDNTTIAGQTAPGEGITIRYYTIRPGANNIWRFIRLRRGQEKDVNDGADATWQRQKKNIILDHCSFSWSIDEIASFYDNRDFTMQWCTLGEALANPGHSKGEHSYGGIWGGKHASFHHNFLAHMQNRVPRFNGARYAWNGYDTELYPNVVQAERVDLRNCVMYNWGTGGCYGGPGGGYINMVNNYFKAGPGTKNTTRVTQVSFLGTAASGESKDLEGLASRYYINGNYVAAAANPQNYDWNGVIYDSGYMNVNGKKMIKDAKGYYPVTDDCEPMGTGGYFVPIKMEAPIECGEVTTHTAEVAFEKVLLYCGASYARDMVDARYMEEARTGTCTYKGCVTGRQGIIDVVADQGEYTVASTSRPANFDSDNDGMPDAWEIANGLDPDNVNDRNQYTLDPRRWYTNLEVYLNSLVEEIMKAENADAIEAVDEYYTGCVAGVSAIDRDNLAPVRFEYYSLDGRRMQSPNVGVNIRRTIMSDDSVVTDKVILK